MRSSMADHLNFQAYVSKTSSDKDIKHALEPYILSYQNGASTFEMLRECIMNWIRTHQVSSSRRKGFTVPSSSSSSTTLATDTASRISKFEDVEIPNALTHFILCTFCKNFLSDPITAFCGHTYCRKCMKKRGILLNCRKCDTPFSSLELNSYKTNVVIASLLKKWWPQQVLSVQLKDEADDLFQKNDLDGALRKYAAAVESGNSSHILESNYSLALLNSGNSLQALQHAERCITLCQEWPKGYYRKAAALLSLGRYEDAAIAYLQCLILDPNWSSVVIELTKLLQKMIAGRFSCTVRQGVALISSSSSDEEDCEERVYEMKNLETISNSNHCEQITKSKEFQKFYQFLDCCQHEVERIKNMEIKKIIPYVDLKRLNSSDFECTLCLRIFWQPVTTPCGHVFCRACLDRCLDHAPRCPLCKTSLHDYLAQRRQAVTEFIEMAMQQYIPEVYAERRLEHEEEIKELTDNEQSAQREIPIFVCTLAFPTISCPLHVFEPRYRLMIRRCLESGGRKFGMCTIDEESDEVFAGYGTILEIRDIDYFPDGRAHVDTVGRERFRVRQKGIKDGYHTAVVDILHDSQDRSNETATLHDTVYNEVRKWMETLRQPSREKILRYFGPLPEMEPNYNEIPNGPSWVWWALAVLPLDRRVQLLVLSMTSLQKRLKAIHHALTYIHSQPR